MSAAKKKRPSGPSGRNTKPGVLLRATVDEFYKWRYAAGEKGMTLTDWIRDRCNRGLPREWRGGDR